MNFRSAGLNLCLYQCQKQSVLAFEIGVEGTTREARSFSDLLDRSASEAVASKELRRCAEELLLRQRLAFLPWQSLFHM